MKNYKISLKILAITVAMTLPYVFGQGGVGWEFSYKENGNDWGFITSPDEKVNNCTEGKKQSPINLLQPIGSYGWAYGETVPISKDQISKQFKNLKKTVIASTDQSQSINKNFPINVLWQDHSLGVSLLETQKKENTFSSQLGKQFFNTAADNFQNINYKFKTQSEHTINGIHQDLELQIFFEASETNDTATTNHAAISVMFSLDKFDTTVTQPQNTTIQKFLDNHRFKDANDQAVDEIALQEFMEIVNMQSRWIYEGSFTTPPCQEGVYWNIIRTVYPIRLNQLEDIKEKMYRASASSGDDPKLVFSEKLFDERDLEGNRLKTPSLKFYRKLQKINDQNIRYVNAKYLAKITAVVTALASTVWIIA